MKMSFYFNNKKFYKAALIIIAFTTLFSAQAAFAARAYIFDYDGNIVEDRKELGGIHKTLYRLFRVHYRTTMVQPEAIGSEVIDISHYDYENLTRVTYEPITRYPRPSLMLSRGEGQVGSLSEYTLEDGRVIVPGYYRIDPYQTYFRYNESLDGRNYFEESFAEAFALSRKGKGILEGPMFDLFYSLINNPETRPYVWVMSSRGHSQKEIIEKLKNDRDKRKLIAADVTDAEIESLAKRHLMLMRPEYQHYDNSMGVPRISVLKGKIAAEIALRVSVANPKNFRTILHPSGERPATIGEVFFSDDRFEYLEAVHNEFRNLAGRRLPVKFMIFNSGRPHEIELSERPRSYVLTSHSDVREFLPAEAEKEIIPRGIIKGVRDIKPAKSKRKCAPLIQGAL